MKLISIYRGRQSSIVDEKVRRVTCREESLPVAADGGPMDPVLLDVKVFEPHSFRADNGALAVDNAFTRKWEA